MVKLLQKYCNKCKRYTIKYGGHYSFEHTSSKSTTSTNKGGSSVVSATASLAVIEEHPAMMHCEIPDYGTPTLIHEFHGDTNDCSVDSCLHALQFPVI